MPMFLADKLRVLVCRFTCEALNRLLRTVRIQEEIYRFLLR